MFERLRFWVYKQTPAYWEIVGFFTLVAFIGVLAGVK